jgi:protein-tyrosine phosphatase
VSETHDATAPASRHLNWDGCFNVRDLGGFRTRDGGRTRWGAVVRSDTPDRLSDAGWRALRLHGVRTIVDLRDDREREQMTESQGVELASVHVPVLDLDDADFWERWRGVHDPAGFYLAVLERWPQGFAAACRAVAEAPPGGVLVHCQVGRDRTGLLAALLLSLVGVPADDVADDYALSGDRLRPLYDRWLQAAGDESTRERLARENACDRTAILAVLERLDVDAYVRRGGFAERHAATLQARLVERAAPR